MSLLDLFCNSNEYKDAFPDQFGRARFYTSGNPDILNPVVSKELYSSGFRPTYPNNKRFAVCISHDIDKIYDWKSGTALLSSVSKSLFKGRFKSVTNEVLHAAKLQGYRDFDLNRLLDLHAPYDIRSTYFLQAFDVKEPDYNYPLKAIEKAVKRIVAEGNEVALHGSPAAIRSKTKFQQEKERLESFLGYTIEGHRSHFLSFQLPDTWRQLADMKLIYDSTIAYPDVIGFRNGMCYPYFPFDIQRREFINIIEMPLVLMDASVFIYMRLDKKVFIHLVEKVIEEIADCGGVFTVLWHNHYLQGIHGEYYRILLDIIVKSDPWIATHKEVIDWWKNNGLLERSHFHLKDILEIRS